MVNERAKIICNLITQTGMRLAKKYGCGVADLGITPKHLSDAADMVISGYITMKSASRVMEILAEEHLEMKV